MISVRPVVQILGWLTCWVGGMLLVPAVTDYFVSDQEWHTFLGAALLAFFAGTALVLSTWQGRAETLNFRQAFLLIVMGWLVVTLLGAIPFVGIGLSFTDSVFETMSGVTTTGSTVLTDLDDLPPGILLWRAVLQWVGGIGIIAVAVLILPLLRIGGMQMFKIESSGSQQDIADLTWKTLPLLFVIYIGLTALCMLAYRVLGMSFFDATTHAMTTLSTGGYSNYDASFGHFHSMPLQWAGTLFMICGAIPFFLFVRATLGNVRALVTDQQVLGFLSFLAIASILMAFWLVEHKDVGYLEALTLTSSNITSVVTTTGYASDDYTAWGHGAVGAFLVLMFVGGCSGSTSGAIKIYRYQVLWIFVRAHIRMLFSPHRVITLRYNGRELGRDVPMSVLAFLAVFIATIAAFTLVLSMMDLDIVTAYSASVTAITNVGPGMGHIIGPAGNFQPLPDSAKWVLVVAMLAGRLEVLALLVLFERDFWIE